MTDWIFKTWKGRITGIFILVTLIVIELYTFTQIVEAATYNVFFNNVEQGANSTSNPQLQISDGKVKKQTEDAPAATTPTTNNTEDTNVTQRPVGSSESSDKPVIASEESKTRKFRFGLMGHVSRINSLDSNYFNYNREFTSRGANISLAYFPMKEMGISLYTGFSALSGRYVEDASANYLGLDMEIVPLRIALFGLEDFIKISGLIGGVTNYHWDTSRALIGAKVGVQFGPRVELAAGVKTNLTDRKTYKETMLDAGIQFHF